MSLEGVPKTLRADVCVVGAGAAGMTLAHALRDAGLSILVLESGPADDPEALDAGEVVGHAYNGLLRGNLGHRDEQHCHRGILAAHSPEIVQLAAVEPVDPGAFELVLHSALAGRVGSRSEVHIHEAAAALA